MFQNRQWLAHSLLGNEKNIHKKRKSVHKFTWKNIIRHIKI